MQNIPITGSMKSYPDKITNNNYPKISVIVPVYNSELFIQRCLNSILEQTFTEFEVILVNDNSPDDCPGICEKYAHNDSRIKVIHNTVNQGSSLSRRIGLNNASGTYIQFIDSDDWIEKNMLERLYITALSDNCDIVWHDFFNFDGKYREQNIKALEKIAILKKLFDSESRISSAIWNKFVKREVLLQVKFPKAMLWEDLVLTIQLVVKAKKINYLSEAYYHHIYNTNSISQNKERKIKGLQEIIENLIFTINYCHEYLGPDFDKLEPELSACVNSFKYEGMFIKEIRNSNILSELYPDSSKELFNKKWKISLLKKIFFYAYINNIPGFFLLIEVLTKLKVCKSLN